MTAARITTPVEQRRIAWIGGTVHGVALDAEATDSRLTVLRSDFRAGAGAPVHVHPDEDETLVILSGSAVVWAGADKWDAHAGDTVFLPRGLPHSYLVAEDADIVTICTPSGMERFFGRAGWDLARGPVPDDWAVDRDALAGAAAEGGQLILGPPLSADDEMPSGLRMWSLERA